MRRKLGNLHKLTERRLENVPTTCTQQPKAIPTRHHFTASRTGRRPGASQALHTSAARVSIPPPSPTLPPATANPVLHGPARLPASYRPTKRPTYPGAGCRANLHRSKASLKLHSTGKRNNRPKPSKPTTPFRTARLPLCCPPRSNTLHQAAVHVQRPRAHYRPNHRPRLAKGRRPMLRSYLVPAKEPLVLSTSTFSCLCESCCQVIGTQVCKQSEVNKMRALQLLSSRAAGRSPIYSLSSGYNFYLLVL